MASRSPDRAAALSVQLAQAHQELRRQINQLRTSRGQRSPGNDVLLGHCLAFCTALTSHHQGEDTGMFADLLRQRPDLATTVANLTEDHKMIAGILRRVAELADEADRSPGDGLAKISRELDGLAAIMESHFSYEERAVSEALDAGTPVTGWSDMVFRVS